MRFAVLGPIRAWAGEDEVPLGSPQQRAVLAALLLRRGQAVGITELVDAVWGADQPVEPVALIRTYVSRLRKVLEPDRTRGEPARLIESVADGYVVRIEEHSLDLVEFEAKVAEGRRLSTAGDLTRASELLRSALTEFGGTPLAGVTGPYAEAERSRLSDLRLGALETRLSADLALGRHQDVVGELPALRAKHPLREVLSELLMVALYRCGRQAEALEVFSSTRRTLVEELGVEPGPSLQDLHSRMLAADPSLSPTAPPPPEPGAGLESVAVVTPSQLPTDLPLFTGRIDALAQAQALLPAGRRPAAAIVNGMAGIGKTSLAVHWAHLIAADFPDGQLFVNLRGFDPDGGALEPATVILLFLDALGVRPHQIPPDLPAQAALYRSLLAERRVLIVLDNARDAEQVRPLLPGTSGCFVIVTSRNQLLGLVACGAAHPLGLELMSTDEARHLLIRQVGEARVAAEPAAVAEIIEHCGRLPLAIAVVAAQAAIHSRFSLAAIAAELKASHGSLDAFTGVDPATDPRAVFSWSYQALSPATARLFRLLSLHTGPDVTAPAAASLAGVAPREARLLLADLARVNLLNETSPGRYAFHDLLLAYSAELVDDHDTEAQQHEARQRVFGHFLHTAFAASVLLSPYREQITLPDLPPGATPEEFTDPQQALRWLRAERRTLVAAILQASEGKYADYAWRLAFMVDLFFYRLGYWHDSLLIHQAALDAAGRTGEPSGQAHAHRGLGFAFVQLERPAEAAHHLTTALELYTGLGDPLGAARTHRCLGFRANGVGDYDAACDHYRKAHALYEGVGDRSGQAAVLNEFGWTWILVGDYDQAVDHCTRAIALYTQTGELNGEAGAHDSLGYAYHHLGDHARAIACYHRALEIYRHIEDHVLEADTLVHVGAAERALGNIDAARAAWTTAAEILERSDHPDARKARKSLRLLDLPSTAA